ncbi:MAG: hypothetical protein U0264_07560 [Candidatus Kapaibacterium sp.]
MNYSEHSAPLTSQELAALRSEYRLGTIVSFAILPILVGTAAVFFVLGSDFWPFRIFSPIFAIMAITIVALNYFKQRNDLRTGTKTIITGTIDDKRERHSTSHTNKSNSHDYYLVLDGHSIAVHSMHYGQFHIGDTVIIEKLPFTGKILSLRRRDEAAASDAIPSAMPAPAHHGLGTAGYSESSYPMSETEEQQLQRAKRKFIVRSFRWVAIPLWCYLGFRFLMMEGSLWQEILHSRLTLTQFIVILPMIIQAFRLPKRLEPYRRDLASGMKTILRTVVSDKRHGVNNGTAFRCISFNNQEYDVPQEFYDAINVGEEIQFHVAEHSHVQFSMNSVTNSSVSVKF